MIGGVNLDKDDLSRRVIKRAEHYGRYTLESIVSAAAKPFTLPSNRRIRREKGHVRLNFLEDVIDHAAAFTVVPLEIMAALSNRPFGYAFVASNIFFIGYELGFRNVGPRAILKYTIKFPGRVLYWLARIPGRITRGARKLPGGIKGWVWGLPRKAAVLACTYALLSSIAFSHYKIVPKFEKFHPERVDVTVREFDFERNNKRYRLYFLGEAHIYNYSSFYFAESLVREVRPDRLLTEGMHVSEKEAMGGWRKYAEEAMFLSRKILAAGANRTYPDVGLVCYNAGIPVIPLEVADKNTGGREGLSDTAYLAIGVVSGLSLAAAPQLYFAGVGLRYGAFPKLEKVAQVAIPGAVYERNEIMVESAVEKIDIFNDPGIPVYFVRMGQAHVEGMVSEIRKWGDLIEVPISFNVSTSPKSH